MRNRPGLVGTAQSPRAVPTRVNAFTVTLLALAFLVGSVGSRAGESLGGQWPAASAFLVLLVAAEYLIVRFRYAGHTDGLTLVEAALAPTIVVLPTPVLMVVVAAAQLIIAVVRKNTPVKTAFNVAQWAVAAGLGSIVFEAAANGEALSPRNATALVAAITTVVAFNIASFTYVIHLAQGERLRAVWRNFAGLRRAWAIGYVVSITLGLLFAAAYQWSPAALALFVVPLAMLHWASRGYAAVVVDQERLAGMHTASRILADPVDPRDAIPAFLEEIRRTFSCEVAELILLDSNTRYVHRASDGTSPILTTEPAILDRSSLGSLIIERAKTTRVTGATGDPTLAAALDRSGFRDCLAAPLIDGDHVIGVLCTYNRGGMEGFDEGEAVVLEALAGEATRAMIKSALLETILEERQKLADIVGSTSDGILTLAPGGTIKTWNPALERITGYAPAQMVGSHLFSVLDVRDSNGQGVCLESWAEHDGPLPADLEIRSYSGAPRWVSCSYTRVRDADDRPTMLIVVARDVTEARELERLKDDFVATVSHELRTPLTPIKGWAVTLLQLGSALDETQREEGVRTILRHADRLERLITNLLEVSRIERGLAERREAIVDVQAIAEKVVGDYHAEQNRRDIRLTVVPGAYRTRGDEVWLEQIVSNLVSNAIKYAPADQPIDVTVSGSGESIEVAVRDRGPGIPAQEAERIFERFKRLGDHMTRSQGGTGLGLYIARQLARAIGGDITVRSTPGEGATFVLELHRTEELVPVAS